MANSKIFKGDIIISVPEKMKIYSEKCKQSKVSIKLKDQYSSFQANNKKITLAR